MGSLAGNLRDTGIETIRCGDQPLRRFQVVGMRCSGTNFLAGLIERNSDLTLSAELGWKHAFPTASVIPADLLVVVSVRDPLDWLRSLYRKPWHFRDQGADLSFSRFIRQPADTVVDQDFLDDEAERATMLMRRPVRQIELLRQRLTAAVLSAHVRGDRPTVVPLPLRDQPLQHDRHPLTGTPFPHPLAMRAAKVTAHLSYAERGCSRVFVRYETIRDRPREFLDVLAARFGIAIAPTFRPVTAWLGEYIEDTSRVAPDRVEPEDARFIAANLDLSLERRLGYEKTALALDSTGGGPREGDRSDVGSARNAVR